jgi:hypothetical protein
VTGGQHEETKVKDISKMSHATASGTLRRLEFRGEGSQEERLALAKRALDTSPLEWEHVWKRRVQIYASDRTVKVKVGGEVTSIDGVPVETIDSVNEIFEEFGKE